MSRWAVPVATYGYRRGMHFKNQPGYSFQHLNTRGLVCFKCRADAPNYSSRPDDTQLHAPAHKKLPGCASQQACDVNCTTMPMLLMLPYDCKHTASAHENMMAYNMPRRHVCQVSIRT